MEEPRKSERKSKILGQGDLIFVTVGTSDDFSRLLVKMDEIAGKLSEEVIMQIGHSSYIPSNAKYFRFEPNERIYDGYIKRARLMVCHAGIGSIIKGINNGIPVIVVPRQKRFLEIRDNHQEETVCAMAKEGLVMVANDLDDLAPILRSPLIASALNLREHDLLVSRLKNYLRPNHGG